MLIRAGNVPGAAIRPYLGCLPILDGAVPDDTIFPECFDPAAHSMVLKTREPA